MHEPLTVLSFSGLAALERFADQINALNLSSARHNPYLSANYLRCICQYSERFPGNDDVRLYTVWEQGQLIACLPLRWVEDRFGLLHASRLCFPAPDDMEMPGMICAEADEKRAARALVQHLCAREPRLGKLELVAQPPESALYQALHQATHARFRARNFEEAPNNEIPLAQPDVASYFRSLSASWRRNVARYSRLLLAAGTPEVVFADGAQATSAWFEAYLDLENRSWKHNTPAAIGRHVRRVELFRHLMAGQGGLTPSFVGILIDGVLVAGALSGSNPDAPPHARGVWVSEIAYDDSYAHLSPGQLLMLLVVHVAIQRKERFVNLMSGLSSYKSHWNAEMIPTHKVQLIRRWSLHNLRGTIGDMVRYLRSRTARNSGTTGRQPQDHQENTDSAKRNSVRPDRSQARTMSAQALASAGPGMQRLDYAQLCKLLPFDAQLSKSPGLS